MCGAPKRVFETQLLICENVNLFVHGFFSIQTLTTTAITCQNHKKGK